MRKLSATISFNIAVLVILGAAAYVDAQEEDTGALIVECGDPGAQVFVDGVNCGRPPAKIDSLARGFHEVVVIAPAKATSVKRIKIEQGKVVRVEFKLSTLSGSVTVATEPPGAKVAIDGRDVGVSPVNAEQLSRGRHTVTARKRGYETRSKGIVLDYGESLSICLQMKKKETVLSVFSFPSQADVFVDGEKSGVTPVRIKGITPGKHELKLVKGGDCQLVEKITVREGDELALDFTLPVAGAILVMDQGPTGRKLYVDGKVRGELRSSRTLVPHGQHSVKVTGWKGSELCRRHLKMEKGATYDITLEPKMELLPRLKGHKSAVLALAFSPDGKTLVSGSKDGSVRLWRLDSGGETLIPRAHPLGVRAVAFCSDGKRIASGGWDSYVRIWDAGSGRKLKEFKTGSRVQAVAWSGDGKYVAAGSDDGIVSVWDMSGPDRAVVLKEHVGAVSVVRFVDDESLLVSGSADGRVCIWKVGDWSQARELEESSPVMAASVSRDGRFLATGCEDGQVRVRHLSSLDSVRVVRVQPNLIRSLAAGWGGVYAAGGHSEKIVFFDAQGNRLLELDDIKGPASALAFEAKGRKLAAGSDSGIIYLWKAE